MSHEFEGEPGIQSWDPILPLPDRTLSNESTIHTDTGGASPVSAIPVSDIEALRPGMDIVGNQRYRLEEKLGQGGYGSVFRARCMTPGTDIPGGSLAIKVFRAPTARGSSAALKRELSSLLAMRHDRIPRVYDWYLGESLAFMVLDYFPRGSLGDMLPLLQRYDDQLSMTLLTDLLGACNAAHRGSLLHLDIKPSNVLIDQAGRFVLTDFGISQGGHLDDSIQIPYGLGTPGYQSPEQSGFQFDRFDTRTDLYSVGATVWAAYTGLDLSRNRHLLNLNGAKGETALPELTTIKPGGSQALSDIVKSLLQVNPRNRPGGAAEVLALIDEVTSGVARDTPTSTARERGEREKAAVHQILAEMVDPLFAAVLGGQDIEKHAVKFEAGELLAREGEKSYTVFILLKGEIAIERGRDRIATERREGTFLGEVSALTGRRRTASMRAITDVWAFEFNAANFERFVAGTPALAMRLVKSLAERLAQERETRDGDQP